MRVLLTRPLEDARRTGEALGRAGHSVILSPVTQILPVQAALPARPFAAIVATSANALANLTPGDVSPQSALPLFAVGARTAAAARAAGFATVITGNGDGADLAAIIHAQLPEYGPVLYLAGTPRSPALEQALAAARHKVHVHLCYRAAPVVGLSRAAVEALDGRMLDAVLHFSHESATRFAALALDAGLAEAARHPLHACLSARVAVGLAPLQARKIAIPARPEQAALFALLDKDH